MSRRAPRGPKKQPRVPLGDPSDPAGLEALSVAYLEWMRIKGYSPRTVETRTGYLDQFAEWCLERSIARPAEVTKPVLERYQRHLYYLRKPNGQPLSFRAQYSRLVPLRAFFKWLARHNLLLFNPASELELPRLEKRLPKAVLSASEAEAVINAADVADPLGLRDRAILETLYSTGMRRSELVGLQIYDLDPERGTVLIRQGKGKKDRMIPIGERALAWIGKYQDEVRPGLAVPPDCGYLFLSADGTPLTTSYLTKLVGGYVAAGGIGKPGSCHLFRHTMATLMLENGADIRFIQQMLGHADLSTTEIYTHVSIRKLQEVHAATHPASRPRKPVPEASTADCTNRGGEDAPG